MPQGIQQAPHSISEPKGKLLFLFCVSLNHLQFAREMSKLHIAHGKTKPMNLLSMCDFWFRCSCLREPRLTNSNTLQPSLSFLLFFPSFFYVCAKRNNHFLCVNAKWPLHRETLTGPTIIRSYAYTVTYVAGRNRCGARREDGGHDNERARKQPLRAKNVLNLFEI